MKALYKKNFFDFGFFLKRFGGLELFLIPLRKLISPIILQFLGSRTFSFNEAEYPYYYANKFQTWSNERCVELAICLPLLKTCHPKDTLEVGNVFSQFMDVPHTVLDKYQESSKIQVINKDICDVDLGAKYRLIVSISTLEHVGYDEGDPPESTQEKIGKAFRNCVRHLAEGGTFIVTLPIGYNPVMDEMIKNGALPMKSHRFLKKIKYSTWIECSKEDALTRKYGSPYSFANALYVGLYQH